MNLVSKDNLLIALTVSLILTFSLSSSVAFSESTSEENLGLRDAKWGMAKDEVIDLKGKPADQYERKGEEVVQYMTTLEGLDSTVYYTFVENKLVTGGYVFLVTHDDADKYIEDFEKIKDRLTDKYGEAKSDQKKWRKETYRGDPDKYGKALSAGHLAYEASWETEETEIYHIMDESDGDILHTIAYFSKEFKDLIN